MNKLEMAHEWYVMQVRRNGCALVADAWKYADAMQAEADKRGANIPKPVLTNADKKKADDLISRSMLMSHSHVVDGVEQENAWSPEEWQPDWSQAPDGRVQYFAVDENSRGGWYINKPDLYHDHWYWADYEERVDNDCYDNAPSFNYQGDWRNSLRNRPK